VYCIIIITDINLLCFLTYTVLLCYTHTTGMPQLKIPTMRSERRFEWLACYTGQFCEQLSIVMVVLTWRGAEIDINIRRILLCAGSVLNASQRFVLVQTMPAPFNF